uniref:Translation initiation factor 1 n=2 Tax=Dalbergieae TaxID=163725 RepID=A0A890CFF0_9FABA|nr:translational initiation factor 1 [Dalbergia oligophylla]QRG30655.1 translation initiation factor 1 [Pterocarpus macrocarpus]WEH00778.1 translational initiation factor 1 [Dalbergia oligophylla]
MFQVHLNLNNENMILDYISEKVRRTLLLYVYDRERKNGSISYLIRLFFQPQHYLF